MDKDIANDSQTELEQNLFTVVDEQPIDILDRQEMVDRIFNMLKALSEAKSSCSFALNGKWGSGKTFILEMLERQLLDYRAGEQFIVFHYNCWQYDYYEEPLTAIVAAMLDNIDKYVSVFSHDAKARIRLGLATAAQEVLKKVASSFLANKIGIDANSLSEIVAVVQEKTSEGVEAQYEYDGHYAFKKVIENAKNELANLTEQQTLVVVVDELDRCLPDYAIRILERLHHLFADLDNTIVLMALDKEQLNNTIKTIFGEKTDCNAYLKKFIDFEFAVDVGAVNDGFFQKYSNYASLFDENVLDSWGDLNNYISLLFSQIEIRRQEHLIKKLQMIHQLLFGAQGQKKDYSFLCFELLMVVLSESEGIIEVPPLHYVEVTPRGKGYSEYRLKIENCIPNPLVTYIKEHWVYQIGICQAPSEHYPVYSGKIDIPLLLIGYSELTYGEKGILSHHSEYSKYNEYINDFKIIKQMLEIIK